MTAPLPLDAAPDVAPGRAAHHDPPGASRTARGTADAAPPSCVGTDVTAEPQPALSFTVWGTPIPQGSHKGFVVNGRAVITQDNKRTRPWRQDVIAAALEVLRVGPEDPQGIAERVGLPFGTAPVEVHVRFVMPRPKAHYRTGRHADQLRDNAPVFCATKPDLDKLLRNLGDAFTAAGVVRDDAQIVVWQASKVYAGPGEKAGAHVQVRQAS